MQGSLLVDKPKGWTSFDVVGFVRRMVAQAEGKKPKNVKVGHTGTLDPLATGLLIILVGKEYTKRAQELTKKDKTYEVVMRLGQESTTGDEAGEKTAISAERPTLEVITAALKKFTGEIEQVPPAYSAIKINGQRAYTLARNGQAVKLEPRKATIYDIRDVSYEYPLVRFTVDVSSGTYIRSIVEDIGRELGTGAYTADLRRTRIADFSIENALPISRSMTAEDIESKLEHIIEK